MQMKVPVEEEELVAETHEEKAEEYMSRNDGREQELKELALLREEYSESIDFLREKALVSQGHFFFHSNNLKSSS